MAADSCPFKLTTDDNEILVGFTTNERTTIQGNNHRSVTTVVGNFRVIASISNNQISLNDGSTIRDGQTFWSVTNQQETVALESSASFLDRMGRDHCVYYASASPAQEKTLYTSSISAGLSPSSNEQNDLFLSLNTRCVEAIDPDPDRPKPECKRPRLMAVSDINKDEHHEYWAIQPYAWDEGVTVWEIIDGKLSVTLQTCVGCSD